MLISLMLSSFLLAAALLRSNVTGEHQTARGTAWDATITSGRRLLQMRTVPAHEEACHNGTWLNRASCKPCKSFEGGVRFKFCTHLLKEAIDIKRHHGTWEARETFNFSMALLAAPSAHLLDVGSRTGWFATVGAVMGHHVIAVEPNTLSSCYIGVNARMNGVSDRVVVMNHGADTEEREMKMVGMRMLPPNDASEIQSSERVFTPKGSLVTRTVRLDELAPLLRSDTIAVQIDVDGFECEAFIGAERIFRTRKVAFVMMEWAGGTDATQRGCSWEAAVKPLREQGLVPFDSAFGRPFDFHPLPAALPRAMTLLWSKHPPPSEPPASHGSHTSKP